MKLTALLVIVGSGVAFAQPKDAKAPAPKPDDSKPEPKPIPPPIPTPAKELETLKTWAKTFSCTGANMAGEKVAPKLTFKRELDNFVYSVKFEVPKTKGSPGFTGMAMFGMDAVAKSIRLSGWDNHGGTLNMKVTLTQSGDVTNTMVWEGDSTGPQGKMPARITYASDGKKLTMTGEFGSKKAFEYECK